MPGLYRLAALFSQRERSQSRLADRESRSFQRPIERPACETFHRTMSTHWLQTPQRSSTGVPVGSKGASVRTVTQRTRGP